MSSSPTPHGGGSGQSDSDTILVVENAFVGSFLRTALAQKGYKVICAEPSVAITLLRDAVRKIDLLITNTPPAFAEFPKLPVLYVAASPNTEAMRGFERWRSLRKPFGPGELLDIVKQLIG